jgi:hypothetical protein
VHGNNLDLGSSHFKESNKKSIFSFFGKNKKSDEGDVSFSFPQQLPVEKEKMKEIPRTANNTNTQNTRSDFFGKIKPLDQ